MTFKVIRIFVLLLLVSCAQAPKEIDPKQEALKNRAKEAVIRLFNATDNKDWKLVESIFTRKVKFDMSSLTKEPPKKIRSSKIARSWQIGFKGIDQIHHQTGNFLVTIPKKGNGYDVFCYATATHYKANNKKKITTFVGSYNFRVIRKGNKWLINSFKFNKKYIL